MAEPRKLPLVMGVLNATPDSFYPGSRTPAPNEATDRALRLAEEGADFIDIGGQSTRPSSEGVSEEEELRRVMPVLEALSGRLQIPISIDTDKARVAREARSAGAVLLNDVRALRGEGMLEEGLKYEAVILMHMGGSSPKEMQKDPSYEDVVEEVKEFFTNRMKVFMQAGGDAARLLIDPGIGFGKNLEHNLTLLRRVQEFVRMGPVVLGVSRKSFIGRLLGSEENPLPPEDRLEGSLALACLAALQGVRILRVHDVSATRRALAVMGAVAEAG